jgi:hypothetical protein
MAYKLIEIYKTEEKETQSLYDCENLSDAIIKLHNDFGAHEKLETNIGGTCVLINNETGEKIDALHFDEPVKDRVYTHNNYASDNVSSYDSERLAEGNFHTKFASQRSNSECTFALTIQLDGKGNFKNFDAYRKNSEE